MRNADDNRYRTGDDPQFGGPIGWGEVKISIPILQDTHNMQ